MRAPEAQQKLAQRVSAGKRFKKNESPGGTKKSHRNSAIAFPIIR
jgi:hypothetical protein